MDGYSSYINFINSYDISAITRYDNLEDFMEYTYTVTNSHVYITDILDSIVYNNAIRILEYVLNDSRYIMAINSRKSYSFRHVIKRGNFDMFKLFMNNKAIDVDIPFKYLMNNVCNIKHDSWIFKYMRFLSKYHIDISYFLGDVDAMVMNSLCYRGYQDSVYMKMLKMFLSDIRVLKNMPLEYLDSYIVTSNLKKVLGLNKKSNIIKYIEIL